MILDSENFLMDVIPSSLFPLRFYLFPLRMNGSSASRTSPSWPKTCFTCTVSSTLLQGAMIPDLK